MNSNFQIKTWESDFGKEYTERNIYSPEALDQFYTDLYGIKRSEMNNRFLGDLNLLDKPILEVGCNVGNQLSLLQKQGYMNLYGVELQAYAVETAKNQTRGINIIQGLGDNLPFRDNYFDLVFTSGVLIHISPDNIRPVLEEIYRCSGKYIWGLEYYAEKYTEINYRGHNNLLWKTDFAKLYLDSFPELTLVRQEKYKYLDNAGNVDSMFLLEKNVKKG